MRRAVLAIVLLAATVAAVSTIATAAAPGTIATRLARLEARIEAGIRSGSLDPREARALRRQFRGLADRERAAAQAGLSTRELNDLTRDLDRLSTRVDAESADRNVRRLETEPDRP